MEVRLVQAEQAEEATLRNLMQLYAHDWSEILPLDVGETGRFDVHGLDAGWEGTTRVPFFFRADGRLAGFALIDRRSRLRDDAEVWDMAEFFVLRRYRRAGVGTTAAHALFAGHPGRWEVRQRAANTTAVAFWRKAIGAYTSGSFTEELQDDDRWRGPVQRFTSGAAG
jgi:predicted acetyltransferase